MLVVAARWRTEPSSGFFFKTKKMKSNFLLLVIVTSLSFPFVSCDQRESSDQKNRAESSQTSNSSGRYHVAPRLVKSDGSFELLAIIKGVEPNRQFVSNLHLVTAQRLELKRLKEQADKASKDAGKAPALEKKLRANSDFMVKNYGYSLAHNYLFIPIESSLMRVDGEKKELVRKMDSPTEYDELQALREQYGEAVRKDGRQSVSVKGLALKLMHEFDFNVESSYTLDVHKGALYKKVGD